MWKKFYSLIIFTCLICSQGLLRADCSDFFSNNSVWVDLDLLYLVPHEQAVVLTNEPTDLFTVADVTLEPVKHPRFEWNFGYRIAAGCTLPNDYCWDVSVNWMHYYSKLRQHKSTGGDIEFGFFPIWSLSDDIIPYDWVSKAKLHWKLNLDLLDIDVGHSFCWCNCLFRPYVGLRAAWINQDFHVKYGGGIFANGLNLFDLDTTFGFDRIKMKNDLAGLGPRIGLESTFNLGCGFGLYCNLSGDLVYGFMDVHQKEVYLKTVRYKAYHHPNGFKGIFDVMAGLSWGTCFDDQYTLTFKLGWEYHYFFDLLGLKRDHFGLVSSNRDLSLNGVCFSTRIDF